MKKCVGNMVSDDTEEDLYVITKIISVTKCTVPELYFRDTDELLRLWILFPGAAYSVKS